MTDKHWTREDFISRLYGVGREDVHLDSCEQCGKEWEKLRSRRNRLLSFDPEVPEDFLVAQRRSTLARLDEPRRLLRFQPLSAMAAVLLILVVLTVFRTVPPRESTEAAPDIQLYQDVLTMASGTAPSAVEPLQSLFEVEP